METIMTNDWEREAVNRMRIAADSLGYERAGKKRHSGGDILTMGTATKAVGAAAVAAAALVFAS